MKKLIIKLLLFTLLFIGINAPINIDTNDYTSQVVGAKTANAYVSVKGYYRSNGTYVAPYVRSNPNGLKYDNYSWTPSQGLYNPTYGTRDTYWDTPTYITDTNYYEGKALYDSGQSGNSTNNNSKTYTLPYINSNQTNEISIPANAYKSGSTWYCNSGYKKVGNSCEKVNNPANSYVLGANWYCNYGYQKIGNSCYKK